MKTGNVFKKKIMIEVFECLDEKKMHPDLFKSHLNGHNKVY